MNPKHTTRRTTIALLELVDDGLLDPVTVLEAALNYMSEDEVADMARINEFIGDDELDEEE